MVKAARAAGETDQWGRSKAASGADLIPMADDADPFYCGTPRHLTWAKWFAALWDEHGGTTTASHHLRRFHYRLFTLAVEMPDGRSYVDDPGNSYKQMQAASRWARYLGLIDPESMDDRRNEPAIVNVAGDDASETVMEMVGQHTSSHA